MIRGFFKERGGRRRPFVNVEIAIPEQGIMGAVDFLVDTGADSTVLAPSDAGPLRIDLGRLPRGLLASESAG